MLPRLARILTNGDQRDCERGGAIKSGASRATYRAGSTWLAVFENFEMHVRTG